MTTPDPNARSAELNAALAIADEADALTLPRFNAQDFSVHWKTNQTEVTEVDRAAEALVVERLINAFPNYGVFGEEHGHCGEPHSASQWVIDPIDGTSGFARGIPVWATLIALVINDNPVLGVVSAPALGVRWWGGVGLGAHVRSQTGMARTLRVSNVNDLAEAQVSISHSQGWDDLGLTGVLVELQCIAQRSRNLGDFWQHMLVAEGAMDIAVDAIGVAPYDLAAILPIVEAAGGTFTDRLGVATYEHDSAISTNGILHDVVIGMLRG